MAADPIITCLDRLTDYRQFERFCCALLSDTDYPRIEPLGGTGDYGLDAIFRDNGQQGVIAFAFTVNKNWLQKLKSDSSRVAETQKKVRTLVFACTSFLTAADKNKAFHYITETYGWRLDLIDLEGLRMRLVNRDYLITHHPSIFDPRYFPDMRQNFAQGYLVEHAWLFNWLANSNENLAIETSIECYKALDYFVATSSNAELVCFDQNTLTTLKQLHDAIRRVWEVISDEHYIVSGWRWKFDNMERSYISVQNILTMKKVEIMHLLEHMRFALQTFVELARRWPSVA